MKRNIILAASFASFTGLCFGLSCLFAEYAKVFMKIWYFAMLAACVFTAAQIVSLSYKLNRVRGRERKRGKEKRK